MSFIDKLVTWIDPVKGLSRERAKLALQQLRAYDGATKGRRTQYWTTPSTSANEETKYTLDTLRDRSRDLVRNNPFASKAANSYAGNLVGTGIIPRVTGSNGKKPEEIWNNWVENADYDGKTDFYGLQTLIARTVFESGECLIVYRPTKRSDGMLPLQIQVLEPDFIDSQKNQELADGGYIVQGVEFDSTGKRVAYWLFPRHPGDSGGKRHTSIRYDANDLIHVFERLRPGQARGVPAFAPVMMKMRDLADYDEAELVSKKIQACYSAFITTAETPQSFGEVTTDSNTGEREQKLSPGRMTYLKHGEDVKFGSPPIAQGYGEYTRAQLHAIAAGLGLTYELLTGDLSQVNYSSIRAGLLEFQRRIEVLRWQVFIPAVCKPVWNRVMAVAQATGQISRLPSSVEWTPPRFGSVDPIKDYTALIMAVRAGLMSLPEAISQQGYETAAVLNEIAETNKLIDGLGLTLDTDPRKVASNGAFQKTETDGAENGQNNN